MAQERGDLGGHRVVIDRFDVVDDLGFEEQEQRRTVRRARVSGEEVWVVRPRRCRR